MLGTLGPVIGDHCHVNPALQSQSPRISTARPSTMVNPKYANSDSILHCQYQIEHCTDSKDSMRKSDPTEIRIPDSKIPRKDGQSISQVAHLLGLRQSDVPQSNWIYLARARQAKAGLHFDSCTMDCTATQYLRDVNSGDELPGIVVLDNPHSRAIRLHQGIAIWTHHNWNCPPV